MATIFSKIVSGEIPCYKIAENDKFLAFLDVFPLAEGHTLVIPKVEIDYLYDMEDSLLADMIVFAKQVARALGAAVPCIKVGTAVIGLEVPHAHIHLIPMNRVDDLNFSRPKLKFEKEKMEQIAEKIKKLL